MSLLEDLRPLAKNLVIDLVEEAGIDVSDWANFKGGPARASTNPKYCYEWAFIQPEKLILLNLWWNEILEWDGELVQVLNFRQDAEKNSVSSRRASWVKRARKMDEALHYALENSLPIRVVLLDGDKRDSSDPDSTKSKVKKRSLDPLSWGVASHDVKTGEWVIRRGVRNLEVIDQFDLLSLRTAKRREVVGQSFKRSSAVRRAALNRSCGKCEWCGERGFVMVDGGVYLETHHIKPLGEGGVDAESNVIALCPNHHREAHFGDQAFRMRESFFRIIRRVDIG